MSDPAAPAHRPVSPLTAAVVLAGFALFLLPVYFAYVKHRPAPLFIPESAPAERLPANQQWQATAGARAAYLTELRAQQRAQLETYGWVDRKSGVVRLPIKQAMELIATQYGKGRP